MSSGDAAPTRSLELEGPLALESGVGLPSVRVAVLSKPNMLTLSRSSMVSFARS